MVRHGPHKYLATNTTVKLALNSATKPVYRSSGQRGFSPHVSSDERRVDARKFEREVSVRFAAQAGIIQTLEGEVHVKIGDAVITGPHGEHWRVSRNHFPEKYRPIPPTVMAKVWTSISTP